jgi:hypothetical protein
MMSTIDEHILCSPYLIGLYRDCIVNETLLRHIAAETAATVRKIIFDRSDSTPSHHRDLSLNTR